MARETLKHIKNGVKRASDVGGAREAQAEATRRALIGAARELFTERGYHDVGIREVAEKAGVTRGAFYHHFGDKESLFLAVFDDVEREMMARDPKRARAGADAWEQFRQGIQSYLDAAMRPDVQRITLIDAPAVFGWARWRKLEEGYGLGSMMQALDAAMKAKLIRRQPVEPLAHLLLGSVMEAAMLIAHSEKPKQRRAEVGKALDSLLRGLE
ncbi:MAG: TetR/AcrR family transcriptional regulator [Caulobacterales bacterium]